MIKYLILLILLHATLWSNAYVFWQYKKIKNELSDSINTYKQAVVNCYNENKSLQQCSSGTHPELNKFKNEDTGASIFVEHGVIKAKIYNKKYGYNYEKSVFMENPKSVTPKWTELKK